MGLTTSFGNGGNAAATFIDPTFLNGPTAFEGETSGGTVGSSFPAGPFVVPVAATPGSGTGGSVAVTYSGTDNAYNFDTTWNGVKDVKATSDQAENVTFRDFVHADVDFSNGGAVTAASSVTLENLKRGNVTTGAGNDTIKITLSTNDAGWQNTVFINSGAGNDSIKVSAGDVSGAAKVTDGHFTTVTIDAGAGDDSIDLSGVKLLGSKVTGGAGSDTIIASQGADTFVYGASDTGLDHIIGFNGAQDHLQLDGGVTITNQFSGNGQFFTFLSSGQTIVSDSVLHA